MLRRSPWYMLSLKVDALVYQRVKKPVFEDGLLESELDSG
jgi:hypothetical protein